MYEKAKRVKRLLTCTGTLAFYLHRFLFMYLFLFVYLIIYLFIYLFISSARHPPSAFEF